MISVLNKQYCNINGRVDSKLFSVLRQGKCQIIINCIPMALFKYN